ncbi:hypothetical protein BDN72DRAFT_899620 [Pluteus cervinus]|uniref:Uncharacterized protein n=1 Tax=Pluteus cervinus TaxID=181527 RepID=A0ACD3AMB1_9AGAR|nr:hypothetical protein BDN72DRAFT_899620 [Pluteus cervinus]
MSSLYVDIDCDRIIQNALDISPETADTHRTQIDLEIAELKSRLRYLHTARNALAPVSRLPSEILAKIFHLLRVDEYGEVVPKEILPISWVSHHWREVVLADATLWDHIDNSNYRWAIWCFIRSKQVPLFVQLSSQVTTILSAETMSRLYRELPHVHSLKLGEWDTRPGTLREEYPIADETEFQSPELEHSGNTLTVLQTLHLTGYIADSFNSYAMPHLADLKLQDCRFNWAEFLVPSLKTLFIQDPQLTVHADDLLRLLSKMPLLEEITLNGVLSGVRAPDHEMGGDPLRVQVSCPNLISFKISDYLSACVADLVNNITTPLRASLCMTTYLSEERIEDLLRPLFQVVHKRFSEAPLSLDTVAISRSDAGGLSFGFGQRNSGRVLGDTIIQAITPFGPTYTFGIVLQLFHQLHLGHVQWLQISGYWELIRREPGFTEFMGFLGTMPNVQELLLEHYIGVEFLEYLAYSPFTALPSNLKAITCSRISSSYMSRPLAESRVETLLLARRNGSVKMILRDVLANSVLERFRSLGKVFDEIYCDEARFLFFPDEDLSYAR